MKHYLLVIALAVILGLAGVWFFSAPLAGASNTTNVTNPWIFKEDVIIGNDSGDTFKIGSSGTAFARVNGGTCFIRPYAATIAATSTAQVDCQGTGAWGANGASALTGVSFGDSVTATLGTSTSGTTLAGLNVNAAEASSTAGFIVLYIRNLTGTTFTWPLTGTASGTAHYVATDL